MSDPMGPSVPGRTLGQRLAAMREGPDSAAHLAFLWGTSVPQAKEWLRRYEYNGYVRRERNAWLLTERGYQHLIRLGLDAFVPRETAEELEAWYAQDGAAK